MEWLFSVLPIPKIPNFAPCKNRLLILSFILLTPKIFVVHLLRFLSESSILTTPLVIPYTLKIILRLKWNRCSQAILEWRNIQESAVFIPSYADTGKAVQLMLLVKMIPVMQKPSQNFCDLLKVIPGEDSVNSVFSDSV
ncbi:hypothetical protein [Desulfobacter postgatei]|uniref:hypothetical protein n=1 Tax=Desulfobacter postgatei TaxID=2293 RepID=UPI001FE046DF|nr:hypothetical protein [Desulfobacter postgatei]